MIRRSFLQTMAGLAITGGLARDTKAAEAVAVPSYLKNYADRFATDPRGAARQWFCEAKFGLFLHYGLYTLLGRHEWVQLRERIPVAEYAKLKDRFTAEKFDADFITDLALAAEMRYVNITTRHHDSFCLFATKQTDFNSVNSPAQRDLVGELAAACRKKGLGLCLYYSHGRDWRHSHTPNNDQWRGSARPKYDPPAPIYAYGQDHDLQKYLDFMTAQITELLTNYGPIAAIWLERTSSRRNTGPWRILPANRWRSAPPCRRRAGAITHKRGTSARTRPGPNSSRPPRPAPICSSTPARCPTAPSRRNTCGFCANWDNASAPRAGPRPLKRTIEIETADHHETQARPPYRPAVCTARRDVRR